MKNIIKRILREQKLSYNEKVSTILEPPYFHNMEEQFGILDENDQLEVMKSIYGNDISIQRVSFHNENNIWDSDGNNIYFEDRGYWDKSEYDSDGEKIYYEDSTGKIIDNR